jgi:putative addiction module antidote
MTELKLVQIGDAVGLVLPEDVLAALHLGAGDSMLLSEAPDGLRLTRNNPGFDSQMEVARRIMKERHEVLRELAK